ncbi:hypothetical protein RHSIM_Rhsim02G0230500 [Rhododendron simsii]|uniref:Uncharacterized protein n=1 Tax=Rhododendron simsii TaxID=118357 RepID=A0A834LX43_RHOSS|nr:hypothetical protein RHSIM_Rhsim02G0230500 [Rhododendron simsii]
MIDEDELILDRVSSLTGFFIKDSTPLHVAALRGHLDFTKTLITWKSELTTELDSSRSSPLHLACTKDHFEIVEELLRVNTNACLGHDEDKCYRLAALEALIDEDELILDRVCSLTGFFINDSTPLQVAALCGHLDFTKALITWKSELATKFDSSRSSPHHLACTKGHFKIVEELLRVNTNVCLGHDEDSTQCYISFLLIAYRSFF